MSYKEIIESFLNAITLSQFASCELQSRSYSDETTRLQKAVDSLVITIYGESPSRQLRLAIDEIIRNAYEHGNLELSGTEKSKLLDAEGLEAALKSRELKYGHRLITVAIEVRGQKICISVADEGSGFDWKKQNTELSCDSLHGRGLAIIKSATDKLLYNDCGNQCSIEKVFALAEKTKAQ